MYFSIGFRQNRLDKVRDIRNFEFITVILETSVHTRSFIFNIGK